MSKLTVMTGEKYVSDSSDESDFIVMGVQFEFDQAGKLIKAKIECREVDTWQRFLYDAEDFADYIADNGYERA